MQREAWCSHFEFFLSGGKYSYRWSWNGYTGFLISTYPDQEGNKLMFLSEWREFPSAPWLAEGKKKLDDSWRLDVVEIARPWHASELVCFLVGLRTYQHPCMWTIYIETVKGRKISYSNRLILSSSHLFVNVIISVPMAVFSAFAILRRNFIWQLKWPTFLRGRERFYRAENLCDGLWFVVSILVLTSRSP